MCLGQYMEKARNVAVSPVSDLDWDDIGSWSSLERHYKKDKNGNIIIGNTMAIDTKSCIIVNRSTKGHLLTALVGVKDLIIIQTDDATLICPKSKDQDIKKIYQAIAGDHQKKHYK